MIGYAIRHRRIDVDRLERRRDFVVAADPVGIVFGDEPIGRRDADAELEIVGLAPHHENIGNEGVLTTIAAFVAQQPGAVEQHRAGVVVVDHGADDMAADDQLVAIETRHAGRIGMDLAESGADIKTATARANTNNIPAAR